MPITLLIYLAKNGEMGATWEVNAPFNLAASISAASIHLELCLLKKKSCLVCPGVGVDIVDMYTSEGAYLLRTSFG